MEPAKTISQQELLEQMQLESTRSWSFNWSFSWLRHCLAAALVLVGRCDFLYPQRTLSGYYLMEGQRADHTQYHWLPISHCCTKPRISCTGHWPGLAVMVALVPFFCLPCSVFPQPADSLVQA